MSTAIIISICSAIVSLAGFIFNVYQFKDRKGSVKIIQYPSWGYDEYDQRCLAGIEFSIVNITERKKMFKSIILSIYTISKAVDYRMLNESIIEIEPNRKFDFKIPSDILYEKVEWENRNKFSFLRLTLVDILDNRFFSAKIYFDSIKVYYKPRLARYLPFGLKKLFQFYEVPSGKLPKERIK